jgi:phage terminase large subunit-like protein
MIEFMQASAPMANAYQLFYQLACEGTLSHNNDPIFNAHIQATGAIKTERGWKVSKLRNNEKIDATVATVLAVDRARHHKNRPRPNIYWIEA